MGLSSRRAQIIRAANMTLEGLEERRLLSSATLEAISAVSVPAQRSLILPLRATDSDGNALQYSFGSTNPDFTVTQHTGNPYLELTVAGFGKMDFQLLSDLAPKTVAAIEGLVYGHFYDGKTFDWAGSTGTGADKYTMIEGGNVNHSINDTPPYYFDDEFNTKAIFTGDGQLAAYKNIIQFSTGPFVTQDTNGTGFFVTKGPARTLDFSNPIFGQLVRGFDVRDAIQAVHTDSNGKPTTAVTITSARIIEDQQDAVVTINSAAAGTGDITVNVDDGHGGTAQRTFHVTSAADRVTDKPFLDVGNLHDLTLPQGGSTTFNLTGQALSGGKTFAMGVFPVTAGTASGLTFTASNTYTGPVRLFLEVKPGASPIFDGQNIYAWIGTPDITNVQATLSTATAGSLRNYQVASFHDTNPTGSPSDFVAKIIWGDGAVTDGVLSGSGGDYIVSGGHNYANNGSYPLRVMLGKSPDSGTDVHDMATIARPESTVTVGNVTVHAGADSTVNEAATFTGSGNFSALSGSSFNATVDYGDGSGSQPLTLTANKTFALSHVYADDGTYHVTVTVTDDQNNSDSDVRDVTVKNVAPTAHIAGGAATVRGQSASIIPSATDPSTPDSAAGFVYVINWGDGKTTTTARGATAATHAYAAANIYSITMQAKDKDGGVSAKITKKIAIHAAQLQADPWDTSKKALVVGGTANADKIAIAPAAGGAVIVKVAGKSIGTFKPTGRIIVFGGAGNDSITVDPRIKTSVELHGDAGNDSLTGGGGNDILLGGASNDLLNGGAGRDVLVGDAGLDKLTGAAGDDMLIAGTAKDENKSLSLKDIMSEWSRTDETYAVRVGNITGSTQGGANGSTVFNASTILSDTSADVLTGGTGADLLFMNSTGTGIRDKAVGKAKTETAVDLA
jgi:cyclophilin family peptidyl-prolyl cis-trans isomerase